MNAKNETYKSIEQMPGNEVFPANTGALLLMFVIILLTFTLSVVALVSY